MDAYTNTNTYDGFLGNDIVTNDKRDVFVTGFNTPNWLTNVSIGNREVAKNFGFNIVWRWQDSFL